MLVYHVRGAEKAQRGYVALKDDGWKDDVLGQWARSRVDLGQKRYPAERPGQRYRRTYQLRYGWRRRKPAPLSRLIENVASSRGRHYAGYVVGRKQAWMHKGRWWVALKVIQEEVPTLAEMLGDEAVRVFEQ